MKELSNWMKEVCIESKSSLNELKCSLIQLEIAVLQ